MSNSAHQDSWQNVLFEEVVNVITDFTANGSFESLRNNVHYLYEENYARLIRLTDLRTGLKNEGVYVDKPSYEYLKKSSVMKGDLLLANVGEYTGMVCMMPELDGLATLGPNMFLIRFNDGYDPSFMFYLMSGDEFSNRIDRISASSATKLLNKTNLRGLSLKAPVKGQQQKIAHILTTIDNLIDKTQSLIDKFTAIKQGMMADLFTRGIDLSGIPNTNPNHGQLRPPYEEAPELYKQTELGWVPKEWEVVCLESVAKVDRGKFTHRPRDDEKCYGGIHPFIQTGSVTKAKGGYISDYSQTLSEFGRSVSREFPRGTIAVTIAANIADTAILNKPMCFPDSIVGVVVNEEKSVIRFIEITIRLNKVRLDALAPLSAQKNINLEDLRPLQIGLPSIVEQLEICEKYNSLDRKVSCENEELNKLQLMKKGLMQDLLTGKVQVK